MASPVFNINEIAFSLKNKSKTDTANICLVGGVLTKTSLADSTLTDGEFRAIDSDILVEAISLESGVVLAHVKEFDLKMDSFISQIQVKVVSDKKQMDCQDLILATVNRKGQKEEKVIKPKFNDALRAFVYQVNTHVRPHISLVLPILKEVKVEIVFIYNS